MRVLVTISSRMYRESPAGIPRWVEVMYTDSMNARIDAGEHVEEVRDIDLGGLLRVVDEAEERRVSSL